MAGEADGTHTMMVRDVANYSECINFGQRDITETYSMEFLVTYLHAYCICANWCHVFSS